MYVSLPISIFVVEKALPSPEFVISPLTKASSLTLVSPPLTTSPTSSIGACLFDSLEEILTLSMIFTWSLTLSSFELMDVNVEVASSLALAIGEVHVASLVVVPLLSHPPSPYYLDWEDDDLLRDEL